MNRLDPAACYRAVQTRDARFDGRPFVGVRTTGIYCRPICPARTPKSVHWRYFASAAADLTDLGIPRARIYARQNLACLRGTTSLDSRQRGKEQR